METLAHARERIRERTTLAEFCDAHLEKRGQDIYVCPKCNSGNNRGAGRGTAAFHLYGDNRDRFKCSACGVGGDIFDLAGIINNTEDHGEQVGIVAAWAGVEERQTDGDTWRNFDDTPMDRGEAIPWGGEATVQSAEATTADEGPKDYTEFYARAHADLLASDEALAYLHGRGLTDETIEAYNLGYVARWTHPKDGRHYTKRVILPRTETTYTARAIDESERDYNPEYKKQVVGSQLDIFNLKAALKAKVVIVVEGELDAASITQATGYAAVGLGSISNRKTFPHKAKAANSDAIWILALDNDETKPDGSNPGKEAQDELLASMEGEGLTCLAIDGARMYGSYKDANEVLVADPSLLKAAIDGVVDGMAEDAYREGMARYSVVDTAEAVRDLYELKDGRTPIQTGLEMLDKLTCGGLHAKSLHIIGAQSSEGKTTITLQVADHVARSGHPVLFCTIEQRASELIAKSLSRIIYKNSGEKTTLTARDITNPQARKGWTSAEWQTFADACGEYAERVAPHMQFMDPDEPPTVQKIWNWARIMADKYGEAPVVFVDYLQLLAPEPGHERDSDKQVTDHNVTLLRRMAGGLNTPVWCVASLNRTSYTGPIDTDSFKESGAIEYGADVLMGLEPFDLPTRWHNATDRTKALIAKNMHDRTRRATRRWMDLQVLKNRFGPLPETGLPFLYQANADAFKTVWKVNRERRSDDNLVIGAPGAGVNEPLELGDDSDTLVM